jgi:hypothetical protein
MLDRQKETMGEWIKGEGEDKLLKRTRKREGTPYRKKVAGLLAS